MAVSIWETRMVINLSDFMRSCQPLGLKEDWLEQHGLCGESRGCAALCVGVHLRAVQSFQREVKWALGAIGIASATARACSLSLFHQERSVVVWNWAGMVLLCWNRFFHTSKMFIGLWNTKFADCKKLQTAALTVSLCKRWLSGFLFLHNRF